MNGIFIQREYFCDLKGAIVIRKRIKAADADRGLIRTTAATDDCQKEG